MSRKTRKLIWAAPLVATVAVIGALALFMALAPETAQAVDEPGKVLNLEANAATGGRPQEEIELTWDAPSDGGPPRYYRIDLSENGGFTWKSLELRWDATRYFHVGLSADKEFHYRVFAVNSEGTGPVSDVVNESTAEATVPDAPTGVSAVVDPLEDNATAEIADHADELTVTVRWNPSPNPDGAPVTHYLVEFSVDGGRFWDQITFEDDEEITGISYDHAMLDAGETYTYRVAAVNSVGPSDWSPTPYPSASTLEGCSAGGAWD